jgi:glutathione S-transferase
MKPTLFVSAGSHHSRRVLVLVQDAFTTADIAVAAALMYAPVVRLPVADHPSVVSWLARVHARRSWKATEPPPMPPRS